MFQQSRHAGSRFRLILAAFCTVLIAGMGSAAKGATLCVSHGGTSGCFATIGAAVSAASQDDTIQVAPGTYTGGVVIGKALSIVGANPERTIIDASGLPNGVYVDGIDNPGLSNVLVTGFTVKNANFEGILVTNASSVTIQNNEVVGNDRSLNISAATCPGLPAFETSEGEDCGEGIHLVGVANSIVADNTSENNSGGILLTDETAATHDNLIIGNTVRNNPFDCGITLASHPAASAGTPYGVYNNTVADNESNHNGYQVPGAGAGVGIFTFLPGGRVSENVVINNRLHNNGLPGVALHAHSPGINLDNNIIVGNEISGNGADTEDAATPGPTGVNVYGLSLSVITGTVIARNTISNEAVDIAISASGQVDAHFNNLLGSGSIGVDNIGTGPVNATENWWGCSEGPGAGWCTSVSGSGVLSSPWLHRPLSGSEGKR